MNEIKFTNLKWIIHVRSSFKKVKANHWLNGKIFIGIKNDSKILLHFQMSPLTFILENEILNNPAQRFIIRLTDFSHSSVHLTTSGPVNITSQFQVSTYYYLESTLPNQFSKSGPSTRNCKIRNLTWYFEEFFYSQILQSSVWELSFFFIRFVHKMKIGGLGSPLLHPPTPHVHTSSSRRPGLKEKVGLNSNRWSNSRIDWH